MTTHAFKDPADPTKGGIWSGDYGIRICTWTWNGATNELAVTCGPRGKRRDLSGLDLRAVNLWERLPQLALQMANLLAQAS